MATRVFNGFCLFVACWLPLFLVGGCSSKEERITVFMSTGDRLLTEGDAAKAVTEYKHAVQTDPENTGAHFALGKAYLANKEYGPALDSFQTALKLDSTFDEARMEAAILLAQYGSPREALKELGRFVGKDVDPVKVGIARARAFANLKLYRNALGALRGIAGADDCAEVQALLALCTRETGDFEAMTKAARRWRVLEPKAVTPSLFLAQYAASKGDREGAALELKAMADANPGDSQTERLRARVLAQIGRLDEAEAAYGNLPVDSATVIERAQFYLRIQKTDEAVKILESFLKDFPGDPDAAVAAARILVAGKNWEKAFDHLDRALSHEPNEADKERLLLAKASFKADSKDLETAERLINEVLQQNQGNMDAHLLMGTVLLNSGRPEQAESYLSRVAQAKPDNVTAQLLWVRALRMSPKDALALDTLKNALTVNPGSTDLRIELTKALLADKEVRAAMQVLDEGVEISPHDLSLRRARGELATASKNFGLAEKDFRHIARIKPELSLGYLGVGQILLAQGKQDEGLEWLKRGAEKEDGWRTAVPAIIRACLDKKDQKQALAVAEAEAAKRPDSALALLLLGETLIETGNAAKAVAPLTKAIELAPASAEPYRALDRSFQGQGKPEKVLAKFEELCRKNPSPVVAMNVALLLEQTGRKDEALKMYDEVIRKSNDSPAVMDEIASLLAENRSARKDLEKAAGLTRVALARQPENATFMDTAAWVAFKMGNLQESEELLQKARQKSPEDADIFFHSAVVAKAKGESRQALEFVRKALGHQMDMVTQRKARDLVKELEG